MKRFIFLVLVLIVMLITINCGVGGFEIAIVQDDARHVAGYIKAGRDINKRDLVRYGMTALMKATNCLSFEVAKLLIDEGADVNAKDHSGRTALMHVFHIVPYSIRKGTETGKSEADMMELLIANGADINSLDADGKTALHYAILADGRTDYIECVKLLIDHGANVNAKANDGTTPLMIAAENQPMEIINLLIDRGADVNAVDKNGLSSWVYAILCSGNQRRILSPEIMNVLTTPENILPAGVAYLFFPMANIDLYDYHTGSNVPLRSIATTISARGIAYDMATLSPGDVRLNAIFKAWSASKTYKGESPISFRATGGHIYLLRYVANLDIGRWEPWIEDVTPAIQGGIVLVNVTSFQRTDQDPPGLTRAERLGENHEYWLISVELENTTSGRVLELDVPNPHIYLSGQSGTNIPSIDFISPMKIEVMNQLGETLKSGLSSDFKFTQKINPGEKMTATIVFEAPKIPAEEAFDLHFLDSLSRQLKIKR